jgi:hypothetical protein
VIALDLRAIASALGGEVTGTQVLAPGPNHSRRDRSMSVKLSATSPDGFIAFSHCGDDWRDIRDHIRQRLGLPADSWKRETKRADPPSRPQTVAAPADDYDRTVKAIKLWRASADPRSTLAEIYLASRKLDLGPNLAGEVLRWNKRIGAMVALFRNIATNEPQAVTRTYLDTEGRKLERKFLGPVGGAAIKIDADDAVTNGLHIAEGVETALAARQLGPKPTWALGSAGAIAAFPVLGGVKCLTLLKEHDDASERAVEACASRWHAAGLEVLINEPIGGKDLNDAIKGTAA